MLSTHLCIVNLSTKGSLENGSSRRDLSPREFGHASTRVYWNEKQTENTIPLWSSVVLWYQTQKSRSRDRFMQCQPLSDNRWVCLNAIDVKRHELIQFRVQDISTSGNATWLGNTHSITLAADSKLQNQPWITCRLWSHRLCNLKRCWCAHSSEIVARTLDS